MHFANLQAAPIGVRLLVLKVDGVSRGIYLERCRILIIMADAFLSSLWRVLELNGCANERRLTSWLAGDDGARSSRPGQQRRRPPPPSCAAAAPAIASPRGT